MMQIVEDEKMTPEQFVYWLQGFMEMAEPEKLTKKQTKMIKDHLALVFTKKTPDYNITVTDTVTESEQITIQAPSFVKKEAHQTGCMCLECRGDIYNKPTALIC